MIFFLLAFWLFIACTLGFQQAPSWQAKDHNGRMRLVGTSFGVAGRNATFDYVVVGGGTAGLTVASRLAEHFSVAVIEAGSFYEIDFGNNSQVPGYVGTGESGEYFLTDWNIVTGPEPGYDNRSIHYPRGRCLGGSSALNNMAYQRPTIGSMDVWAQLVGDNSWTWRNVLPFFKMSVNFTPPLFEKIMPKIPIEYRHEAYSPKGGPLKVSYQNYQQPLTVPVTEAFEQIGVEQIPDFVSGELNGWAILSYTIDPKFATRSSAETSFLQHALQKSPTSIQVYQHALAKRILFDEQKKATGVQVTVRGSIDFDFTLSARKEVIVSAGAFLSPQLLMVSGVGPAATLQEHGIEVIADRPGVGQNLQDQPYFGSTYRVNFTTQSELTNNATVAAEALKQYLTDQSGPLSNIGSDILGWEKLPAENRRHLSNSTLQVLSSYPADWPEIEFLSISSAASPVPDDGANYMTSSFGIMTPSSRGYVSIKNNDTSTLPEVRFNFLTTKADQELAIQGFRRVREWSNATGLVLEEISPGSNVQTDEQILQYLRQSGMFLYHASCTCAMGRPDDPNAVVDTKARVYGVRGLRVVDASAFPVLPPGHPQATVYMLAEKIAEDIIRGGRK